MAFSSIDGVSITGISAAVPGAERSNHDYNEISEGEKSLLIKTTGIERLRIADSNTATSDLCYHAAKRLFDDCEINPTEIGILIFVSQSPDYYLPASSILLQHRLGLGEETVAFDINLGCSGYVYGISVIAGLMQSLNIERGLLVAGDISSWSCSPEDKSTYPLFGDAGSATLLEKRQSSKRIYASFNSDGSGYKSIFIPDGGMRNMVSLKSFEKEIFSEGIRRNRLNLSLDGTAVFSFAISKVPQSITDLLQCYDIPIDDIDYFVMHQANLIMNETIRKKLGIPRGKTPYSLDEFGNTSSASIPLTMVTRLKEEVRGKRLWMLLSGFGVGLSWANMLVNFDDVWFSELVEVGSDVCEV